MRYGSDEVQCPLGLFGISREATYAAEFVFKFFYEADIAAPVWCVIKPLCLGVAMATCWHVEYVSFVLKKVYFFSFLFFL